MSLIYYYFVLLTASFLYPYHFNLLHFSASKLAFSSSVQYHFLYLYLYNYLFIIVTNIFVVVVVLVAVC